MKRFSNLRAWMRFDITAFLLCISFFLVMPQFDLQVSRYFYDSGSATFFLKNHSIPRFIYSFTHLIGMTVVIFLITTIASSWLLKKEYLIQRRRALIFLLIACILGPGLVVNLGLKDNWGRPRPRQIIEFGGEKKFEPPFQPSFECKNCHSFVSGHASVGFYFFALVLIAGKRKWLWLPVLAGTIIGAARIAQGGHFFSDVVFSGWAVWFSTLFLFAFIFKPNKTTP